jgi:hypothetical protein
MTMLAAATLTLSGWDLAAVFAVCVLAVLVAGRVR